MNWFQKLIDWLRGKEDPKPTPAPTPTPTPIPTPDPAPQPDQDDDEDGLPPLPEQKFAPRYDISGATALSWGGGTLWNPSASKGPKLVLGSKWNGKVAWVAAWGGGFYNTPKRFGGWEEGRRQRWYFPRTLPAALTIRLHIPGGTDAYLVVTNTSKRHD